MTDPWLTAHTATAIGLGLAAGFAMALVHLAALAVNVRLYLTPGTIWRPIGLHVLRLTAIGSGFTMAAMLGALPLVAMLVGFSAGRMLTLRRRR